jgi:alpha-amylase
MSGVMLQAFHWHTRADGSLWRELSGRAAELAERGFTSVWIPPSYKGAGGKHGRGYAVYDLFDLGEFDQKGGVRTRYGTRDELLSAVSALRHAGIEVYADMVFNHRCGADEVEEVEARVVQEDQRNEVISDAFTMKAWTRFNFPGRAGKYSEMVWDKRHFLAVDCNADAPDERKIYLFAGKTFSGEVSFEQGNYDFLMGCDVDTYNEEVRAELGRFGEWYVNATGVDGFRLDAIKHIPASFIKGWLADIRGRFPDRELLAVGEYWMADAESLSRYLAAVDHSTHLFDVPLHFRMLTASQQGNTFDLRTIFDGALVQVEPQFAVTFVDNHDTQPGSSLESWVGDWFKPLAYALILLRRDGYPCVFFPDYYGHEGEGGALASHRVLLDAMLDARRRYGFGEQTDYFDHPNCIAWLRSGDAQHPGAMVVVMSNGDAGTKRIETGQKGATFRDLTGHAPDPISTGDDGAAEFSCPAGSLSVWVED